MNIDKLRINGYGRLNNTEINLSNKINIIYGENESGKSTIFNFIVSMLYGVSKNKRGKEISDLDRYTPWNQNEFSGKIEYTLDDGKSYKVYREFKKNFPIIYNEKEEDITNKYIIDKNKGNQFFYDQTKINEEMFLASTAVIQQGTKIENQDKNSIIQKLSNIAGSGNDNISFKKSIDKLNKKQLTEIGTERSQDRPINKINIKLEELEKEKKELLRYQDEKYLTEENAEKLKEQILELEKEREELKEYAQIEQKIILEEEKIKVNMQINEANKLEIKEIEQEKLKKEEELKNSIKCTKVNINKKKYVILAIIVAIINILCIAMVENNFKYLCLISIIIFAMWSITDINKNKNKQTKKNNKKINMQKDELNKISSQLEMLKNNANTVQEAIDAVKFKIDNEVQDKEKIKKAQLKLEEKIDQINELKVKLQGIELEQKNILPKVEKLANIQEEITALQEEKANLLKKNESIEIAKSTLEEAYKIMRENITPQFICNLSEIISKISNGKYNKVKIDELNNLVIELESGKNVTIELLSTGTIEQLYLAFRIAVIKEITNENMPLILDEVYAYYDSFRLKSILQYFQNLDKQVIIFTCTNREKEILDNMGVKYNFIKLTNIL